MIPTASLPDGFKKTVQGARKALEKRLTRQGDQRIKTTWTYHQGEADLRKIPGNGIAHVWLAPKRIAMGPHQTFGGVGFTVTWQIQILMRDTGSDPDGFNIDHAETTIDDVLGVLFDRRIDRDLDGTIESIDNFNATWSDGVPPGQDRQWGLWVATFDATHPLLLHCD